MNSKLAYRIKSGDFEQQYNIFDWIIAIEVARRNTNYAEVGTDYLIDCAYEILCNSYYLIKKIKKGGTLNG